MGDLGCCPDLRKSVAKHLRQFNGCKMRSVAKPRAAMKSAAISVAPARRKKVSANAPARVTAA
jgi:hypothetical protein